VSPSIAAVVFVLGILGLFLLDRERKVRTSWALWLPTAWLLLAGSRAVSTWLDMTPTRSPEQYLEGSPLDRAVYVSMLAAGFIALFGRRRIVAKVLRKNWPIVAFVLYCAISITWSDYPGVALKRWIKSLGDYVMVLIVLTDHDRERALKHVLARAAFLLMPLSVLFIKYYPGVGRGYAAHWEGTQFFIGVADNKNMLGMTCLVFGFAALWRVLQGWSEPRRERNKILLVHGSILAMAIWLLLKSDSKTSLACFVATSGLIVAHTFFKVARKRVVVNLLVAAAVVASFSVLFLGIGGGLLETMGRNSTLTGRTDIWEVLLKVPINPVFGTGFESFWLGKRLAYLWTFQIVNGINEAHDGYFEVYLNLGWIGVAFLAGLLWTGYRNILRLLERDPEAGRLRLGFFVIAVIYNFTEAGIRTTDLVWIAFIFAVMALPKRPLPLASASKTRFTKATIGSEQFV
jgi:exopolysaccharide production protein ExoQ